MTELSGDPNQPLKSEHAFYHSMEELIPVFERYRLQLHIEAYPYDFSERNDDAVQIVRGLNRPWINYCFCIPHAFHLSDGAGDMNIRAVSGLDNFAKRWLARRTVPSGSRDRPVLA